MAGIGRVFRRKYKKGDVEHLSKFFSIAVPRPGREQIISTRTTSEAEAKKVLRKYLTDKNAPTKPLTVAEACAKWIEGRSVADSGRGGSIKPSTLEFWQRHIDAHIVPYIGDYHIQDLRTDKVEELRDYLRSKNLSGRSVNKVLQTLTAILQNQIRLGNLVANPAAVAQRLATGSHEVGEAGEIDDDREVQPEAVYSPDELHRILECARPGFDQTILTVFALTMMRHGEVLGLKWSDIDFDAAQGSRVDVGERPEPNHGLGGRHGGEITVRRSWGGYYRNGEPVFWTPKTKHSVRTLKMPDELAIVLKKWKLISPPVIGGALPRLDSSLASDSPSGRDLVFSQPNGRPLFRTYAGQALKRAAKLAGLRCLTIHSLRHSGASIHLMLGTPLPEVSAMLGHGNVNITLQVYTHFIPKMRGDSSALAGAIFGGKNDSKTRTIF